MKSLVGMKKCNMLHVVINVILYSCSYSGSVHGGTLARPLSPVKVLAAAGIAEPVDKLRYYTFSEEEENARNRDRSGGGPPEGSQHPYSSKDPFEVPSLSAIAEMMRRSEQERRENRGGGGGKFSDREEGGGRSGGGGCGGCRPEHRQTDNNADTGWGWPKHGTHERDRDDEGRGGWSGQSSTWAPPPRPPPPTSAPSGWGWQTTTPPPRDGWGWDKSGREEDDYSPPRPSYGKGSYSPVDNKDAFRPWQIEGGGASSGGDHGWGPTTTERPKYTPKYLASDEDKYKPIRYPPSSGSGGWSDSSKQPAPAWPPSKNQDGWDSRDRDRDRGRTAYQDGPGPVYLPPRNDPYPREPPLKDPPKWPTHSNDRDRNSGGRDGWESERRPPPSRWETERPRNGGWESERRPQPTQSSWSNRDEQGPHNKGGWSSGGRPPPPPPRPTTPGWGWDRDSQRRDPPRQQSPFEYKPGSDDLTKYIPPVEVYEKAEYPPGFSRDRPYSSKFDNSVEDDSFPRAPNHYRIVAETPSPAEIQKILRQKPTPEPVSRTYLPPISSSSGSGSRNGNGQSGNGWSQPKPGSNNEAKRKLEEDKEKWYKENFQKTPEDHPIDSDRVSNNPSSPSKHQPEKKADDPKKSSNVADISPASSSSDGNDKPTAKRTRFDAQGFKYIPYDHPVSKKIASPPRDIYANLDFRSDGSGRDSFKRAVIDRIKEKSEQQQQLKQGGIKQESNTRLQGSESRTSFVRRTLTSRSHIPLWKSDDHSSSSSSTTVATIRRSPFIKITTTTTQIPLKEKEEIIKTEDFGRKINIIRNRVVIKKREQGQGGGGFKPVSGPFGPGSAKVVKVREALLEGPKEKEIFYPSNLTNVMANSGSTSPNPLSLSSSSPLTFTQCSPTGSKPCPDEDEDETGQTTTLPTPPILLAYSITDDTPIKNSTSSH